MLQCQREKLERRTLARRPTAGVCFLFSFEVSSFLSSRLFLSPPCPSSIQTAPWWFCSWSHDAVTVGGKRRSTVWVSCFRRRTSLEVDVRLLVPPWLLSQGDGRLVTVVAPYSGEWSALVIWEGGGSVCSCLCGWWFGVGLRLRRGVVLMKEASVELKSLNWRLSLV